MNGIDLSKLIVIKELRWELRIEEWMKNPFENGGYKLESELILFEYYKDKIGCYWLSSCSIPEK